MKSPVMSQIAAMSFDEGERILHIETIEGAEMNLENTKEHYRIIEDLTQNKEHIALINAANYFMIDAEALKYTAKRKTIGKRVASAHYNSGIANLLTVSFFKDQFKPKIPVRIFKTKNDALKMDQNFKNTNESFRYFLKLSNKFFLCCFFLPVYISPLKRE